MEIIKFDIDELKRKEDGFSFYILGRSYDLEENGCPQDYKKAIEYYYKGMNINDPLCEYSIGISYILGLGDVLQVDLRKGDMLLKRAYPKILKMLDDDNLSFDEKVYARFVIGAYNYFGLGSVSEDKKKAFQIISQCAEDGHIAAIYDLGANFYYNGVGCTKDIKKAKKYLAIAMEAGLVRAEKKYHEYQFDKNLKNKK